MPLKPTVFISSTILDFKEVRADLRVSLEHQGYRVLTSEDDQTFPATPGETSHDACLHAIRKSQVFILLVGMRFGGEYSTQNKSITWREWEEAMKARLSPIVLVLEMANQLSVKCADARRSLDPNLTIPQQDKKLRADNRFKDDRAASARKRFPGVQRFIDTLRRGHRDNWCHLSWNGTHEQALTIVQKQLGAMFLEYQDHWRAGRELVAKQEVAADSVRRLADVATALLPKGLGLIPSLEAFLKVVAIERGAALGFETDDKYVLQVHWHRDGKMHPGPRAATASIPSHGRVWDVGMGHAGLAFQRDSVLISGDIRQSDAQPGPDQKRPDDTSFYISVVSLGLPLGESKVNNATLTVTSDRLDHFRDKSQREVLIFQTIGRIATLMTTEMST